MSFDRLPAALSAVSDAVAAGLDPDLAAMFRRCFANTWRTTMRRLDDGTVFVQTGDIPAMWLRDSAAQIRPYLAAALDEEVYRTLAAVLRRQTMLVRTDPYANAFHAAPGVPGHRDSPPPGPMVWERKYELDSLCAPLLLGYALWRAASRSDHLDDDFFRAAESIVALWRLEQHHSERSPYQFARADSWALDRLGPDGRGTPVGPTGMTWSGFRPSDDACEYGYLIPANAMAAVALHALAELAERGGRGALAGEARALRDEIRAGIRRFGTVEAPAGGVVYAYEVDGLGHHLFQDDANVPSLLALPYLGFCSMEDPIYRRTRDLVLSKANPHYHHGLRAAGIGSPHTPGRRVWPLALTMQALTTSDDDERRRLARLVHDTDAGTGFVHESFDVDDPWAYTRPWFGWGNALYSELLMELAGHDVRRWFPALTAPPRPDLPREGASP